MAIKRKTINIKKVKLVKPKYNKVIPKKVSIPFVEPIRVDVSDIQVKKKVKNRISQKQKKKKKVKQIRKGPIVLTSKQLTKLKKPKKQKVKKQKVRKTKKTHTSTFASAFPNEPGQDFSDLTVNFESVKSTTLSKFYIALQSVVDTSTRPKLASIGSDYIFDLVKDDISEMSDDELTMFLINNPLTEFFDAKDLFYGGLGIVTGDSSRIWSLEQQGRELADTISYGYLNELANSDYWDEGI